MNELKGVRLELNEWEEVINSLKDLAIVLRQVGDGRRADKLEELALEISREEKN